MMRCGRFAITLALAGGGGIALIGAGCEDKRATAARPGNPAEVRGIQRAASDYFALQCETCRWQVRQVRISTVDPRFATAVLRPRTAKGVPFQGADLLLWHGTDRWAVISYGSDPGIGCGYVRRVVRQELFGTATCP